MLSKYSSQETQGTREISKLSSEEQVNYFVKEMEPMTSRSSALPTLEKAAELGLIKRYKEDKWKLTEGGRSQNAGGILEAFFSLPKPPKEKKRARNEINGVEQAAAKRRAEKMRELFGSLSSLPTDLQTGIRQPLLSTLCRKSQLDSK